MDLLQAAIVANQGAPPVLTWTPATPGTLRAGWTLANLRDAVDAPLANTFDLATWLDDMGAYHANVVTGTAPVGVVSTGGVVVPSFGGAGAIGTTPGAIPDDVACCVGAVFRTPAVNLSARDYDAILSFTNSATTNYQGHFCIQRSAVPNLRVGFAAQVSGAGFGSWWGDTVLTVSTWYRAIWVLEGDEMQIYVNGTLQSLTVDTDTGPTIGQWLSVMTACNTITIGGRLWSSGLSEQWTDQMGPIWWYGAALDAPNLASFDAWLAARQAEVD